MIYILQGLMLVLRAFEFIILIWALMSWLPGAQRSRFGQLLGRLAGLIIDPIRRVMPRTGMLDFSPLIGIILLQLAQMGIQMISQGF
ncbi:putative membrane protein [Weissella oryzae SG25]|uniref:Putative membrane protein n=1 Tax=Weissella oryzae (strain DSM 25784 / JCM 18191 / LMG 30913 / SG25) TaxID=1329250 RepID=A0A069CS53_WEIOS|nr:YggT family protein [Weissella oryzae]GAK30640.1 putative membrane protein [Weissella oryzae SG25]